MDPLYNALSAIKVLRCSVGQVFNCLANGVRADHGEIEQGRDAKFLTELEELLAGVHQHLREVEQSVSSLSQPPGALSLGNTSFLSQECSQERQALYNQLVLSYKWTDKIHEYCHHALQIFTQNSLRRSHTNSSSAKRRRTQTSTHNVPPQNVDVVISNIDRQYPDMNITISRPFATNAVSHVTLGRILQCVIAFKGLMIEWIVVKGHGEQMDLWTESRHKVFRKVTENAHAAMLHFSSPMLPEFAVRSFMTWLHSYITLFSEPCKRCGYHLYNGLPCTWRDFRSLEAFHEECKH